MTRRERNPAGTAIASMTSAASEFGEIGVRYELSETESLLDNSYLTPIT